MKERFPATLEGLVSAARKDGPSTSELSRLADEAAQAAATAAQPSSVLRILLRPPVVIAVAVAATAFGTFAAVHESAQSPSANARSAVASNEAPPLLKVSPPLGASSESEPGSHAAPVDEPSTGTPAPEVPSLDIRSLPAAQSPQPSRKAAPEGAKPAPADESEGALLHRAHAVMAAEPEQALALTAEHLRRFPNGMLAQEREVIAIETLARLGRMEQAQRRAKTFYQMYPNTAYRRRVDDALASDASAGKR